MVTIDFTDPLLWFFVWLCVAVMFTLTGAFFAEGWAGYTVLFWMFGGLLFWVIFGIVNVLT